MSRVARPCPSERSLPFCDRRAAERRPGSGDLIATYRDGTGRMGLTRVEVVDSSSTGLAVFSAARIEPGMIVTVTSIGRGQSPVAWASARAMRCEAAEGGYRVGLAFATPRAA